MRGWRDNDTQLRNLLVRARATTLGRDPVPYLREHRDVDTSIEKAVTDAYTRETPRDREIALARFRRAQAETLGIEDVVTFAGFRENLDDLMGCFDLFVHPALAEGLCVATLKAQAAGVAVIGFAAGGLPEAVQHEETGLLVAPEDVAALQTAIRTLIDNDELRGRYGDAGRKRMQKDFSIATMAARHVELYESILDG